MELNASTSIRISRLTALIFFALAAFFAGGVRAQIHDVYDDAWECTNALSPDGAVLTMAFIAPTIGIETSFSTNGGSSWSTPSHSISPGNQIYTSGTDDEKLAYRYYANKQQLIMVYRAENQGNSIEGTFVDFSSDNGSAWDASPGVQTVEAHSNDGYKTVRPAVAVDKSGGGYNNNAYITWTTTGNGKSYVKFAKISATNETVVSNQIIGNYNSFSNGGVDACDISVGPNGAVYVLWRHTDNLGMRTFYIDKSTDAGATWTNYTINRDSPKSPKPGGTHIYMTYQDYPCMAISHTCAGIDSVFVAYTRGTSNDDMNPSDLWLTSASLSNLFVWTNYNVNADNANTYTSEYYKFQFEPQLAPDGQGGVFLLYYSGLPYPYYTGVGYVQNQLAMLYENGQRGQQRMLSTPVSGSLLNITVDDYVGILWDPFLHVARPAWTDYNASTGVNSIYSDTIAPSPIQGASSSYTIGDLGFSHQRRAVMTDNMAHVVGVAPQLGNPQAGVWYSEQTSNSNGTATDWTKPIEIDNGDPGTILSQPAEAVYQSTRNQAQKAIAVVWSSTPTYSCTGSSSAPEIYIRVKEYCECEGASASDWSPVDSFSVPGLSVGGLPRPVVAPLTVPGSPSSNRYLLGWIITYPIDNAIVSRTYLRGTQTGPGVELDNENWGAQNWPAHYASKWTANISTVDAGSGLVITSKSFVTVTSNQSNGSGTAIGNNDMTQDVMYTGDGDNYLSNSVNDVTTTYNIGGTNLGELQSESNLQWLDNNFLWYLVGNPYGEFPVWLDRNPSVTITSTGQKIAAWEHLDNYAVDFYNGHIFVYTTLYNKSSIRVDQTNGRGYWSGIKDVYTESANDDNFFDPQAGTKGWMLNPSVTAFPMTSLTNTSDNTTDKDPGAAELLFWQQATLTGTSFPMTKQLVNHIDEQQFYERKGVIWTGGWNYVPQSWYPHYMWWTYPYFGANSQRSFGIFNTGPQYHPTPLPPNDLRLFQHPLPAMDLYVHGLSYGMSNNIVGGSIQLTTQSEDVGALKDIGTYDTAIGVQLYRSETRMKDSSMVTFKWGKVYVEDTALGEPIREVMLQNNVPDSDVYASHDAMRDSIFQTEWFNWPVSAQIKYNRLMTFPVLGILNHVVDTSIDTNIRFDSITHDSSIIYDTIPGDSVLVYYPVFTDSVIIYGTVYDSITGGYDSVGVSDTAVIDSAMVYDTSYIDTTMHYDTTLVGLATVYDTVYDTVPGTFHPDTTRRTDSSFMAPGVSMKYTIQLIHASGHIDTVEQLVYDPYNGKHITPETVTIDNAGYADDTVMLRIIGDFSGIPDADSNVEFEREVMLDTYPSLSDTTLAIGSGGAILPPLDSCFYASGPYSNPSNPGANDVSILVHYCGIGSTISAQVYDNLGNPIGTASTYTSDGQTWDRLPITAPGTSGTYHIQVTVGSYTTVLGYSVY